MISILQPPNQLSSDETFDLGLSDFSLSLKNKSIGIKDGKLLSIISQRFLQVFLITLGNDF